jgi:hypothetical protein
VSTFRRDGVYRHRFMWWFPWGVTRPWLPRVFKGGDEWCNDSVGFVVPPLGALIVFCRPGPLRTMPCSEDWEAMDNWQRADYAPCGVYWDGRNRKGAHMHFGGPCTEAWVWLATNDLLATPAPAPQ